VTARIDEQQLSGRLATISGLRSVRLVHSAEGLCRRVGETHCVSAVVEPHCGKLDSSLTSHGISRDAASASERPARTVVLAGGQLLVRAARHSVLSRSGIPVIADVADAPTAADAAELYRAGVVLVDADVPGGCVRAVRRIVQQAPAAAVLVIAPELDPESLLAALRAGATGFVPETLGPRGIVRAVEVAFDGEAVIPRAGVVALIDQLQGRGLEQTSVDGLQLQLTRREADVITRLQDGMTPKEIAYELDLSDITVRRHRSSVAKKKRQARPLTHALESTS
jgi:DNA-binding NarL/FixJ family response regulator